MKLLNLTYNELVKQFKKLSTKIIIALILISAIVLPIVMKNIKANDYSKSRIESAEFMIQDIENGLNDIKDDKSQKAAIQRRYYEIDKEYNQLIIDNNIGFEDWKQKEVDNFRSEAYSLAAIEFVLEGYSKDVVLEKLQSEDPVKVSNYYDLTLVKKKEIEAEYIAKINEIKDILSNNNYNRHTELEIERKKEELLRFKNDIAEYEKLAAKNPSDEEGKAKLEELKKLKETAEELIPLSEQDLAIIQFRYDNKIDYDKNNWKNNSILVVESTLSEYRTKMLDEKSFNVSYSNNTLASNYDEYIESFNKANAVRVEKIKEIWYGLENNIPDLGAVKDSRSIIDSTYEIYVILAVVVAIIIGGGIVASEYSNGSIRLLMIRPVSRWKILLSKLLAVLLVSFGIVVLGVTLLIISSAYTFGVETLKIPVLLTIDGVITKVDYIKYMLPQLVISTASLLFITSLVFMISTLARNTALAVALGMLLYIGVAPLSEILISLKQLWVINTMIPYINGSYFKILPNLTQVLKESGMSLNYALGAKQLTVLSIIILVITFIVFMKKDIKN